MRDMVSMQAFFRQNGYLRARTAVAPALRRKINALVAKPSSWPKGLVERDSTGRPIRFEGVAQNLELFEDLSRPPFATRVNSLLGQSWTIILNRHNHVTVDYGQGGKSERFHRDSLNWTRGYVTAVIMIESPSSYLSWPRIIPGSHLWPIAGPPNWGGYWLDQDGSKDSVNQAVPVPLNVDDALFLDPLTFHAAGFGGEDPPRIVLTLAIRASDELALTDAANEIRIMGRHAYRGQSGWVTFRESR